MNKALQQQRIQHSYIGLACLYFIITCDNLHNEVQTPHHRWQHASCCSKNVYHTEAYLVLQIDFPLCQSWYEIRPLSHVQTAVGQTMHHSRGHGNMELPYAINTNRKKYHQNTVILIRNID
jgi:hypothetical protein